MGKYAEASTATIRPCASTKKRSCSASWLKRLNDKGLLYERLGDAASAERSFRRAIELARAINHPRGVMLNLMALGDLEGHRKRLEEAGALYREALGRASQAEDRASAAAIRQRARLRPPRPGAARAGRGEAAQAVQAARAIGARPLEAEALFARAEVARGPPLV